MKSERVDRENEEGHGVWVAMALGASQPTLALGRQTSNCHVGQDCAWRSCLLGRLIESPDLL